MTVRARAFVEAEKAGGRNVAKACELLEVSRSAFYVWHAHVASKRQATDRQLIEEITRLHAASGGTYGAPRIHADLVDAGVHVGPKRVARLMIAAGLAGRCRRRTKRTTIADPEARALNLLGRAFGPQGLAVDTRWAGDITYIRTWEGWAYLATVIDLASRRVVGWALADHMETGLVNQAMDMALAQRRPASGLLFHSDRGSQYTSGEFRRLLARHGIVQSLSRRGQCWDNAVAESWFGTYKLELIESRSWPTVAGLRTATFDYIERWYNRTRRHSSLNHLSPTVYEHRLTHQTPATQAA